MTVAKVDRQGVAALNDDGMDTVNLIVTAVAFFECLHLVDWLEFKEIIHPGGLRDGLIRLFVIFVIPGLTAAVSNVLLQPLMVTPQRICWVKRLVGAALVIWLGNTAWNYAHQPAHGVCLETKPNDPTYNDCYDWVVVPGPDRGNTVLFLGMAGYALWRTMRIHQRGSQSLGCDDER
jgi:hypothetical protein